MLDIYVYRDNLITPYNQQMAQARKGARVVEIQGKPNFAEVIEDTLDTREGKIAISGRFLVPLFPTCLMVIVCASQDISTKVCDTVARIMRRDVRLIKLDFQPFQTSDNTLTRKRTMSIICQGINSS